MLTASYMAHTAYLRDEYKVCFLTVTNSDGTEKDLLEPESDWAPLDAPQVLPAGSHFSSISSDGTWDYTLPKGFSR